MPGGGISPDGKEWVSCRPGFLLRVRVLSKPFRRLFPEKLAGGPRRLKPASPTFDNSSNGWFDDSCLKSIWSSAQDALQICYA